MKASGRQALSASISILTLAAALAVPAAALAQAAPAGTEVEELVVTGTNIRGAAPTGSTVSVMSRDDIDASAPATADRLIRELPQVAALGATEGVVAGTQDAASNRSYGNGVNLRGLGPDATLTMVNSHRVARSGTFANFTDISIIPTIMIERLEVVADGSSAVYGSDAIGGVVNLILRSKYDGFKVQARGGTGKGVDEWQASFLAGQSWSTGSFVFAAEKYYRSNLPAEERDYAIQNMLALGGTRDYRSTLASPGNIVFGGVTYGIPPGQNGVGLTSSQLRAGQPNLQDANYLTDLLPQQKRENLTLTLRQEITPQLTFTGDAFYNFRRFNQRPQGASTGTLAVPRTNPYFVAPPGFPATTATVPVMYSFVNDLGPRNDVGYSKDIGYAGKFDYEINDNWQANAGIFWSQNNSLRAQMNTINNTALTAALNSTNRATAFNAFGCCGGNPQNVIDSIRARSDSKPSNRIWGVNAQASGTLFTLPGGDLKVAAGVSYQKETFILKNSDSLTGPFTVTAQDRTERSSKAIFAEVQVPLIGEENAMPFARRLVVSLAGRHENYSTAAGSTTDPKVGVIWTPIEGLDFRTSYGTSFKAPGIAYTTLELARLVQVGNVVDPTRGGAQVTRLLRTGGNPDLTPETAETWSYGVDWQPSFVPGLRLSLTYFDIEYKNRLANPGITLAQKAIWAPYIIENPSQALVNQYTSGQFGRFVGVIPPAGTVAYIFDQRFQNVGGLNTDGLDFAGSYRFDTDFGQVSLSASATRVFNFETQSAKGLPFQERRGFSGFQADLKARADATLESGPWRGSVGLQYVDGMKNDTITPLAKVDSHTTVDLSLSYTTDENVWVWARGIQVQLTVENLFNNDPPFVENVSGASALYGFDPVNASPLGRFTALRISKEF